MPESPPVDALSRCHPWQQAPWTRLREAGLAGRLPHALLLQGDAGTGRNAFAFALARQILCHSPTPDGNCGQCKACILAASGGHGDFLQVCPEAPGKAIGIDAIRAALRFATGTSTQGQSKVLLISPAEDLTVSAFNAFLKCLEEPTPGTFILLVNARGRSLPATIRSRCQRLALPSPGQDEALEWLHQAGLAQAYTDAQLREQLELASNRPQRVAELLASGEAEKLARFDAALLRRPTGTGEALAAAATLDTEPLLEHAERRVQGWLRVQSVDVLRGEAGRRAFEALSVIERFRRARRAGSHPNDDLLRFSVVHAWEQLWERSGDSGRLSQTSAGNSSR